jgi:hypothetical protein
MSRDAVAGLSIQLMCNTAIAEVPAGSRSGLSGGEYQALPGCGRVGLESRFAGAIRVPNRSEVTLE